MNKKIRFSLEIEFQNDGLTDDAIREAWKHYSNYEKMVEDKENWAIMEYQKRLLDVLVSDKVLLDQYLKFRLMTEIEMLDFRSLQKITDTIDQDELTVITEATKKLNYVDKAFFEQVIESGTLSEHTDELSHSFKMLSRKITVEDISHNEKKEAESLPPLIGFM